MNTLKNEKGSVLVLMIAVVFVVAYLLLMMAMQIEVRVASYQRTRDYLTMNLLEQEGLSRLENFVAGMDVPIDFVDTWMLRNGAVMIINGEKIGNFFAFSYQIRYNGFIWARQIRFCFELGYMHFYIN